MNRRDRVLAAISHQPLDRIPTDIWYTPETRQKLLAYFGVDHDTDLYDRMDIDGIVNIAPPYIGPPLRREGDAWFNEWGMGYRPQDYGAGVYDEQFYYPLAEAQTIADLEAYPWPSPDWYDYAALPRLAEQAAGRAVMCGYAVPFFYHNKLRGLELSLMDPLLDPAFTEHLLRRLSDFFTEYHRRCFEAAPGLIDVTQVTDDWGGQNGLLASPQTFETFYRAPTQRAIDLAHAYGIHVFHHDDGDIRRLIPTFADMGIQVLNPIQWRCGGWDLAALKAQVGARVCFHGGVDNQHTLPFGTPEDVRQEVRWLIRVLASDQTGYILAPCHNIQAITPLENILAMYEAAREYGTF